MYHVTSIVTLCFLISVSWLIPLPEIYGENGSRHVGCIHRNPDTINAQNQWKHDHGNQFEKDGLTYGNFRCHRTIIKCRKEGRCKDWKTTDGKGQGIQTQTMQGKGIEFLAVSREQPGQR